MTEKENGRIVKQIRIKPVPMEIRTSTIKTACMNASILSLSKKGIR
jgi:hypothetical protein